MPLPILVVEDNNINREVALLQLKALGFESEAVGDGNKALEAIKSRQFALILMDVMMPAMDGWEASRRIREYENSIGRHTPIIAVSAWSAADNKDRCLSSGMDDYLGKPYDRASLKQILDQWVTAESKR
jgi:CheY-like chemotaxis protein